jgi:hypothetical protein
MVNEFLKSDSFNEQIEQSGKTPVARLNGLTKILCNWNKQRIGKIINDREADLSLEDIKILKSIIEVEARRLRLKNCETVTDQILFLVIGAIKLQVQNKSEKPWELVNLSITHFLTPQYLIKKRQMSLYFLTLIIIIGFLISLLNPYKNDRTGIRPDFPDISSDSSMNEAGNKTVSNLVDLYSVMKKGDCQLPQAAMLQPKEREAFIMFVNEGRVDISTAENLKNALTYASCLYPQKLMNNPL